MTEKTVDGYIAGLNAWQANAVRRLRSIVKAAAPKATESIKIQCTRRLEPAPRFH
jgi:hypothetical protein